MKKLLLLITCFTIICGICGCNSDVDEPNGNEFTLDGRWYISGRPKYYGFESDSVSFTYNQHILGYEEYTFTPIEGQKDLYSVSLNMWFLKQEEGESDEEYTNRVNSGMYSESELVNYNTTRCPQWIISGNDIIIPGRYIGDFENDVVMFRFVKKTRNKFVIISASLSVVDLAVDNPFSYKHYLTFTRIR